MGAIIAVTLISMFLSFCCSLMEAALYSITPSKIEELRSTGSKEGERLARLRANVDEPIAAILTVNTIANSMGAALAGALVGTHFADKAELASLVYGCVFTLLILYCSEILPKTLGVTFADRVAPALSLPMLMMVRVAKPFVMAGQIVTRLVRRGESEKSKGPSEKEILALAELGAKSGTLMADEARWAMNALKLNDVTARDLMTPRTVVYLLPADLPMSMIVENSKHWSYSRLPVVKNNDPDQVEGIIYRREVFDELAHRTKEELSQRKLRDLMHPVVFVPETLKCNELLRALLDSKQHLSVVTNEYGGMEGVVSLEDVLEFILGEEIVDPHDKHADMQEYARRIAERRMRRTEAGSLVGKTGKETEKPQAGGKQ